MPSETHIVPVRVGCPVRAKAITDRLMREHGIYVQPINYPTVPRGTERLRLTPSPAHGDALMRELVSALVETWNAVGSGLEKVAWETEQPQIAEEDGWQPKSVILRSFWRCSCR
jgi:5-aminolevulinate synthase